MMFGKVLDVLVLHGNALRLLTGLRLRTVSE